MKEILISGWSLLILTIASDIGVPLNEYEYLEALLEMNVTTAAIMVKIALILSRHIRRCPVG